MKLQILYLTCRSCFVEIKNDLPYYTDSPFDVYLNEKLIYQTINTNCFSIYDLTPDTIYNLQVKFFDCLMELTFKTKSTKFVLNVNDFKTSTSIDDTAAIQAAIMACPKDGLVVIPEGDYHIRPIFLKDNINIYLSKNAKLIAEPNRDFYPVLPSRIKDCNDSEIILGTWEGEPNDIYCSPITGINISNVNIYGEGIIDGNALSSDWWVDFKIKKGAYRPRGIFLNNCSNITIQGITIQNTASWTLHPYYCNNLNFFDLKIINPDDSPNTDGCNPESCDHVNIIGVNFSVGDDCIAIKSGKIYLAHNHFKPSSNITIRNCLMDKGHGAIVFGSEMSCGINNIVVSQCIFQNTDRGFRIKTRRGRGDKGIISNIVFDNVYMKNVKNAFVVNMFYFCDPDGKSEYVKSKTPLPIDERTPHLGKIEFKNITCEDCLISAGFFYGLPESPIEQIRLENITVTYSSIIEYGQPAMMSDIEDVSKLGFYFNNVSDVSVKNVNITGQNGEDFILKNVGNFYKE